MVEIFAVAVSLAALALSAITIVLNGRATAAAAKSADEAERSAVAAEDSVELSRSERARSIERSDVTFTKHHTRGSGVFTFVNAGHDTAHTVEAVVYVNGERRAFQYGDVLAGDSFEIDLSTEAQTAQRQAAAVSASYSGSGISYAAVSKFYATTRVSWVSLHGTPAIQSFDNREPKGRTGQVW